jgi:hypothetical protein
MKRVLVTMGFVLALTTGNIVAETAATVNGMEITVAEADGALKTLTKGDMTWAKLPEKDRKQLIEMMAPSKLVAAASKKGLTDKEKEAALAGFWMQKKMSGVGISDDEAKAAYEKMKKAAEAAKSKQQIPSFDQAKNNIKMQLAQEKVVGELMKNAKIKLK